MKTEKIKILFADDHAIVRDGLRSIFKSEPEFTIVGEASNGEEAISLIADQRPDVAVLDISMPKVTGVEATRVVKKNYPDTGILILTIHEDEEYIQEMVQAGADGYVLKDAGKKEIFDAVRTIADGGTFFSSQVSQVLLNGIVKRNRTSDPYAKGDESKLTNRETEILRMVAEGLTSKQIADKLFLSVTTVNRHRTNIMKKINIHDAVGLVKYAIRKKLIEIGPRP